MQVLIWDDVFRKHTHPALDRLMPKVIVCVWQYRAVNEVFVENMVKLGAEVWGASRIQTNTHYRGMGRLKLKYKNLNDWMLVNEKYELAGHIGTLWGRSQCLSPLNAALPEAMYMAAYLASGLVNGKVDREKFDREFAAGYFNTPEFNLHEFADCIGCDPDWGKQFLIEVNKNQDIMEHWQLLNELDSFFKYCDRCFAANQGMLAGYRKGAIPPKLTRNYLDGVRITRERAAELKGKLRALFAKYYAKGQIAEYLASRFDDILETNARWGEVLTQAACDYAPQLPGKVVADTESQA